jgi:hypothetical protein
VIVAPAVTAVVIESVIVFVYGGSAATGVAHGQ